MSSKLLSIKVFLTVCLMCIIGGGNCAWAQETAVFTFNTKDGLTALGITAPASGKGTNLGTNTYTVNKITMSSTDGGTPTRIWNASGSYELRAYAGASIIFTASEGYKITQITFTGSYDKVTTEDSKFTKGTWTGLESSVTFNVGTKPTVKIKTATITYAKTTPITLTTAQYGTYFTDEAFVMPEGVTGYTITAKDGENLTLNEAYTAGTTVPASTALVLKATDELTESKTFNAVVVNSTEVAPTDNLLHGSVDETQTNVEGAAAYYKLANGDKGLGFYYGAENGAAFTNGAHKAYLAVAGTMSQMKGFSLDGMTTGISQVSTANATNNTNIYDLNGRRIQSLGAAQKGIYIVGGKKVIVK